MKRSFIREILDVITQETISFAGGLPDASLFPLEALRAAADRVLHDPASLQYTRSQGESSLREKIAARYSEAGFATHPDEILITTGSQQAINLIAGAFLENGVTVELPAYLGALNVFRLAGVSVEGAALHSDGIDIEGLRRSSERTKAAYLIPDFQNPTGTCYSEAVRAAAAEVLAANGALLIEDAAYSELYFKQKMRPISAELSTQSFHLGSFSKILAPGLRVGWIRTDREKIKRLLIVKEAMDLHTATLNQRIIDAYWQVHGLDGHIALIRSSYRAKMEAMAEVLPRMLPDFAFRKPEGGMFIYGSLPGVDTMALVWRCIANSAAFVPGSEFYPGEGPTDEIRFNYTNATPEQMEQGMRIIAEQIAVLKEISGKI